MGGIISHYALFKYPDIFGKVGIFSPSYWFSKEIISFTKSSLYFKDQYIYIAVGEKEGSGMIKAVTKTEKLLKEKGFDQNNLKVKIVPGKNHNEAFWRSELPEMLICLFK